MSFKDELIERVAQTRAPYLWDGKFADVLNRSKHFTAEQASEAVEAKRKDHLVEAEEYIKLILPLVLHELDIAVREYRIEQAIIDLRAEWL